MWTSHIEMICLWNCIQSIPPSRNWEKRFPDGEKQIRQVMYYGSYHADNRGKLSTQMQSAVSLNFVSCVEAPRRDYPKNPNKQSMRFWVGECMRWFRLKQTKQAEWGERGCDLILGSSRLETSRQRDSGFSLCDFGLASVGDVGDASREERERERTRREQTQRRS